MFCTNFKLLAYQQAGAMLLITIDGSDIEQVEREYESIGELCFDYGAIEVYVADNPTTSERIWKIRRNIAEAYGIIGARQTGEDIVVPPAEIPGMVENLDELSEKYDLLTPCFGHAGDGNIHVHIMLDKSIPRERQQAEAAIDKVFDYTRNKTNKRISKNVKYFLTFGK